MSVRPIPEGYHTVTPYLLVRGVRELLDFLTAAFDAVVTEKLEIPGGAVMHAQVKIGDSFVMMGEAKDEWDPMPSCLYLYVEDMEALYKSALAAGATSVEEPKDQFYGDRSAGVKDPVGNLWFVATHFEDVPPDEIQRRAAAAHGGAT